MYVTASRLDIFEIRVGQTFDERDFDAMSFDLCVKFNGTFPFGATWQWSCLRPLRGRYLTLVIPISQYLSICEIQAFGERGERFEPF